MLEGDYINETYAAIASGSASSAISIVRVGGRAAYKTALALLEVASLEPRHARLARILDSDGTLLDTGIIIYYKAPNSYNGEDIIEFQCHGGIMVARLVLRALLKAGARLATPGEFSKRAYLNGKLSLSKCKAISALINASSAKGVKNFARIIDGRIDALMLEAKEELLYARASLEVCIDYSEELDASIEASIKEVLERLERRFASILAASKRKENKSDVLAVALIGNTNAGKSSLLNALALEELAITSDIEGTTRDSIRGSIYIDDTPLSIIDTAGIRESEDAIENLGIERSLRELAKADVIIALLDGTRPLHESADIIEMIASQKSEDARVIYTINKSDMQGALSVSALEELDARLGIESIVRISALNHELDELLCALREVVASSNTEELYLASTYEIDLLEQICSAIGLARTQLKDDAIELASHELARASRVVDLFNTHSSSEDVLEVMFSEFCLGK